MNIKQTIAVLSVLTLPLLLAGCTSSGANNDEVQEAFQDGVDKGVSAASKKVEEAYLRGIAETEAKYNPPSKTVAERTERSTVDVDPATHVFYSVQGNSTIHIEYDIIHYGGPALDLYVMKASERTKYVANETFDWDDNCSDLYTQTVTRTCDLSPGSYVIVLDNTVVGPAKPGTGDDETVRLRFQFEATVGA